MSRDVDKTIGDAVDEADGVEDGVEDDGDDGDDDGDDGGMREAREMAKATSERRKLKIRKTVAAQQAHKTSHGRKAHRNERREWGRSCLAFDKARRGGFYTRFGKMTSTLQDQWVAMKNKYERMKIQLATGRSVS